MSELLALVQWIGGEFHNTYTPGVPINWIQDFDPNNYDPEDADITYVVEWRTEKRKKKQFWPVYDARVFLVSSKMKVLEKKMKKLEGVISPLSIKKKIENESNKENSFLSSKRKLENVYDSPSNPKKKSSNNLAALLSPNVSRNISPFGSPTKSLPSASPHHQMQSSPNASPNRVSPAEPSSLNASNVTSNHDYFEFLKTKILNMEKKIDSIKKIQENKTKNEDQDGKIEIGAAGSGVKINRAQWETANSRSTYTEMGISLVRAVFSVDTLLKSNLGGGKSKIHSNSHQRPGLDKHKMTAIISTVKEKYPGFKQGTFGIAINNMLNNMRRKNKLESISAV